MSVQIDLWALLTALLGLLLAFFGAQAGVAKFILAQMDARLRERFDGQQQQSTRWADQLATIDRQLTDHRERIARLEESAKSAPTHSDLSELQELVSGLAQTLSTLSGEFSGAKQTLQLIHAFLLRGEQR